MMNNKSMDIMEMVAIKSMVNNFKVNKHACGCVRTTFMEENERIGYEIVKHSVFPNCNEIDRFFKDLNILKGFTPDNLPRYVINIHNEETKVNSYFSVHDDMIILCDTDIINDRLEVYHMTFDMDPKLYIESLTIASVIYEFICL